MWSSSDIQTISESLRRFVRPKNRDQRGVDDLVQDAWLAALESGEPIQDLPAWLKTVAARGSIKQHRSERRRNRREETWARLSSSTFDPSLDAEAADSARKIHREIARMSSPYREILTLRLIHEKSVDEISVELERPLATVHSQWRRGLHQLRERVGGPQNLGLLGWLIKGGRSLRLALHSMLARPAVTRGIVAVSLIAAIWLGWRGVENLSQQPFLTPEPKSHARSSFASADPDQNLPVSIDQSTHQEVSRTTSDRILIDDPGLSIQTRQGTTAAPRGHIRLRLIPEPRRSDEEDSRMPVELVSDASGLAVLESLPSGRWSVVPEKGRSREIVITQGKPQKVEIEVYEGISIQGRVVDEDFIPVPFAEVFISWPHGSKPTLHTLSTDSQGVFSARGIDLRSWVQARRSPHQESPFCRVDTIGKSEFILELGPPTIMHRGVVIDSHGDRIEGVRARLKTPPPPPFFEREGIYWTPPSPNDRVSAQDGTFEIPLSLNESHSLSLYHPKHGSLLVEDPVKGEGVWTYELKPHGRVFGTVHSPESNSHRSRIRFESVGDSFHKEVLTATDGTFEVLAPRLFPLKITAFDQSPTHRRFAQSILDPQDPSHIDLTLGEAYAIRGVVQGTSTSLYRVELISVPNPGTWFRSLFAPSSRVLDQTLTDENGQFQVHAPPPTPSLGLRVIDPTTETTVGWQPVSTNQSIQRIKLHPSSLSIQGRVSSPRNLDNAELLWINSVDQLVHRAPLTFQNLTFKLAGLFPTQYEIRVWMPGRGTFPLGLRTVSSEGPLRFDDIVIPDAASLRVRVDHADGRLVLESQEMRLTKFLERSEGVEFDRLFPGEYTLTLHPGDQQPSIQKNLELRPGSNSLTW